jgi:methylated-DNA-[protein]-cysteine S-methyltransferase
MLHRRELSSLNMRFLEAGVSTYKRIAGHLGIPNGARVIGNALARNPFPIIIPCHRAVRTDGSLGGYQGGVKMKRTLLEMEDVEFSDKGKVIMTKVYY